MLVALAVADFADDVGKAWPSIATLARKARCAERTVQDAISALRRRGELAVEVGSGPHGTNIFRLNFGGGAKFAPPQKATGRGANCGEKGVRQAAPKPPEKNRQRTTTPRTRGGGVEVEVEVEDDLVAAAAWAAAAAGKPPRSPAGFAAAVRRRLREEGANAEDLANLERWRAAQAAREREREREGGGGDEPRRSARPDQLAALARAIGR